MKFKVPGNLTDLTAAALTRLRGEAADEYNELFTAAQAAGSDNVTQAQLDDLYALRSFVADADAHLTTLAADAATDGSGDGGQLAELAPIKQYEQPTTTTDPAAGDGVDGPVKVADAEPITVSVGDVAAAGLLAGDAGKVVDAAVARMSLVASAGLPDFVPGAEVPDLGALGQAVAKQMLGYLGLSGGQSATTALAAFKLPPNEFVVHGDQRDRDVLTAACDEKRLPGGSLVAARTGAFKDSGGRLESVTASGWCAPSEIDYSVQFYGAASGLFDTPTVTATRGGLWVMPEIGYANVIGMAPAPGSNFFRFTEAQLIAGAVKSFFTLDCPTPHEYRLGVVGMGIVTNLLEVRAYPEYVREFIRAALIGLQTIRAAANVAAVRAGSVAYNLTAAPPWVSDGSVVSQVLPAAEMAAMDQRYRDALPPTATIEQVFPMWLLAQMRADWLRRNAAPDPKLADSWIMDWFSQRYIAPQFIYGWQDRYDATDGGLLWPGGDPTVAGERMTMLPTNLHFLSYPAGTWVEATADVITLRSVYDSVRLASNERVELFTEQGTRMIPRRSDSRVYELTICPTGDTGMQRQIVCTTQG